MVVSALLLSGVLAARPVPLEAGDHERSLIADKRTRSYLIHVPPAYKGKRPFPVVLAFHGGGSNARQMIPFCGLNDKADQAGFIVVYPNGTGRLKRILTFNGGNCCGYALREKVDDVAFVRALLDDLARVTNIDPKRIFATGMSNGAIMSYRLASELSERIAAIAPVGGPMGTETCHPKRPVSVIHFHGTNDDFAGFDGGAGRRSVSRTNFYSVKHSIRAWVKANGCPAQPVTTQLPDRAADGMTVTQAVYGPGNQGTEVVLVTIHGGGHTWPGRPSRARWLGLSTRDISANDLMWEFFKKHPLK